MSAVYASTVADTLAMGGTEAMASAGIGNNFFHNTTTGFNAYFAAMNLSGPKNGEMMVNYTAATGGSASFTNLTYAFQRCK